MWLFYQIPSAAKERVRVRVRSKTILHDQIKPMSLCNVSLRRASLPRCRGSMSEVLQKAQQLCAKTTEAKALASVWVGTVKRAVFGQRSVAGHCIAGRNVLRHPPSVGSLSQWARRRSHHRTVTREACAEWAPLLNWMLRVSLCGGKDRTAGERGGCTEKCC